MASPSDNPLKRLIREIHRRSLWQVLGIYLVASWAVLGGVDTLGGALGLPDWFLPVALALLVVGLPIVLATAFVQEGMSGRSAGDEEVAPPPGGAFGLFTWRNAFGGGVLAFALLGFVGTGWILFGGGLRRSEAPAPFEQSIAVMPCTDLTGDQAALAQGLAEGVITALAQIPDLKVIGINSVIALLEENADIETIARRLDVATVLECSLQQAGDVIRIRPTLIEAASGTVLWSEEIDGPATNVFAIQDQVARAVTDELQVVFAAGEDTPLVAQGTTVPEAHEAYLRGRYFWNQRTGESLRRAITEFQRALALDSNYAEAYSGLADSYLLVDVYAETLEDADFRTNLVQGLAVARDAVRLAPDLGMAHTSLAFGLWNVGEWESAQREFEQAIELSPGYAPAHFWYGYSMFATGSAVEGVPYVERALRLDPVSRIISTNLGKALQAAGRTEEAIEQFRETTELAPDWSPGWRDLAIALFEVGEYDEGLESWATLARLSNADVQAARDAYEAATRFRESGEPQSFSDGPGALVGVIWQAANSGQLDRAIELFEDYLVRPGAYGYAAIFDVLYVANLLRGDPRYQALLAQAGITW